MQLRRPAQFRDVFSVFYLVTHSSIILHAFIFLLCAVTLNIGVLYFAYKTAAPLPFVITFLLVFFDLFLINSFVFLCAANIDSYIDQRRGLDLTGIITKFKERGIVLLTQPISTALVVLLTGFIIFLLSLFTSVISFGPVLYSLTYIISFTAALAAIISIFYFLLGLILTGPLLADRPAGITALLRQVHNLFFLSFPRFIAVRSIAALCNLFYTLVIACFFAGAFLLTMDVAHQYSVFSGSPPVLSLMIHTIPFGDTIINLLSDVPDLRTFAQSAEAIARIPQSFRIGGFLFGIMLYLLTLLAASFSFGFWSASNYATYHIIRQYTE